MIAGIQRSRPDRRRHRSLSQVQKLSAWRLHRFGRCAGAAGLSVVAGASSGVQVMALRSYWNPLARNGCSPSSRNFTAAA